MNDKKCRRAVKCVNNASMRACSSLKMRWNCGKCITSKWDSNAIIWNALNVDECIRINEILNAFFLNVVECNKMTLHAASLECVRRNVYFFWSNAQEWHKMYKNATGQTSHAFRARITLIPSPPHSARLRSCSQWDCHHLPRSVWSLEARPALCWECWSPCALEALVRHSTR